jgi:hypothetical protein
MWYILLWMSVGGVTSAIKLINQVNDCSLTQTHSILFEIASGENTKQNKVQTVVEFHFG